MHILVTNDDMESIIWHIPGIAFSLDANKHGHETVDYSAAARVARLITRMTLQRGLPKGVFLNVNIPYLYPTRRQSEGATGRKKCQIMPVAGIPAEMLQGIQLTRQGLRVYRDRLDERQDPRGRAYYWIGGDSPTGVPEEGTDVGALAGGYVSVTPLQMDLTAYYVMPGLQEWGWSHLEIMPRSVELRGLAEIVGQESHQAV